MDVHECMFLCLDFRYIDFFSIQFLFVSRGPQGQHITMFYLMMLVFQQMIYRNSCILYLMCKLIFVQVADGISCNCIDLIII